MELTQEQKHIRGLSDMDVLDFMGICQGDSSLYSAIRSSRRASRCELLVWNKIVLETTTGNRRSNEMIENTLHIQLVLCSENPRRSIRTISALFTISATVLFQVLAWHIVAMPLKKESDSPF